MYFLSRSLQAEKCSRKKGKPEAVERSSSLQPHFAQVILLLKRMRGYILMLMRVTRSQMGARIGVVHVRHTGLHIPKFISSGDE